MTRDDRTPVQQEEYAAVLERLRDYYDGLYHQDLDKLRRVFAPSARYASAATGEWIEMGVEEYLPRLAARTPPADSGTAYEYAVDQITFAGPTAASARLRCALFGNEYTDLLTLVRIGDEWRIQSKVFHAEPIAS